jgi:cytochrome c oxidase assembly protein subunit 15
MAGLKAAAAAPTWPDMNGSWFPSTIHSFGGRQFKGLSYFTDHPLVIHFIHRNLAYIISILVFIWWWKAYKIKGTKLFQKTKWLPLLIVLLQVLLGILTVLNAGNKYSFLWLAIAHQFVAMILLLSLVWILYIVRNKSIAISL